MTGSQKPGQPSQPGSYEEALRVTFYVLLLLTDGFHTWLHQLEKPLTSPLPGAHTFINIFFLTPHQVNGDKPIKVNQKRSGIHTSILCNSIKKGYPVHIATSRERLLGLNSPLADTPP